MNKNVLDLKYPFSVHLPGNTHILSILLTRVNAYDWIMENFVNISIDNESNEDYFRHNQWYDCPFLITSSITFELAKTMHGKFSDFIINSIDLGYYIYPYFINIKYISNYNIHIDSAHNPLIFGYDKENRCIDIADFFQGTYSFQKCSFDEINNAFSHYTDAPGLREDFSILLCKLKDNVEYKFDHRQFKSKLYDYINSINLYEKYNKSILVNIYEDYNEYSFGISYYDKLKELVINEKCGQRPIHLIVAHKQMMLKRIEYLYNNNLLNNYDELHNECNELINLCLIIRNIFLKNTIILNYKCKNIDRVIKNKENIILKLNTVKVKDLYFTKTLINSLIE